MRVLYVDHSDKVSGAQVVLMRLVASLPGEVETVALCQSRGQTKDKYAGVFDRVLTTSIPTPPHKGSIVRWISYLGRVLMAAIRIVGLVVRERIDVIHANSFKATLVCVLPSLVTGRTLLWHMHDIPRPSRANRWAARLAGRAAHRVLAVSKATRDGLISLGLDPRKIAVVYNGVDIYDIESRASSPVGDAEALRLGANGQVVTMVGAMAEWKGQDIFVTAARRVLERRNSLTFLLVGDTLEPRDEEFKTRVASMIESSGCNGSIRMLGRRDDALSIINASDLVAHCSRLPDPLPTVILEAMSLGKPVVASRIGGVPEMVDHGITGYTFTPEKDEELALLINRLVDDPKTGQRLGAEGRRKIETRFTMIENVKQIMAVYNGVQ